MVEIAQILAKIDGVGGAVLVAEDGVVLAHTLEGDAEKEGAVAAFLGAAAAQAGEAMKLGRLKRVTVSMANNHIVVLKSKEYFVGLLLQEGASPALVASRAETLLEGVK
ncbi:MAG: roadblock/LC7 domain-containing protein [Anaerolineales bacterium]|jgi:predicted regulator of Ras-like GTPase activity (Roadblock/LC7/MglB family)